MGGVPIGLLARASGLGQPRRPFCYSLIQMLMLEIIVLYVLVGFLFIIAWGHKRTMENLADRIDELEDGENSDL